MPRGVQTSSSWWHRRSWSNGSLGLCASNAQSCPQKLRHHWYSQTHTSSRNCRDGSCCPKVATKHLHSPCSRGFARSCTRFSCMFSLPGKLAGRTLWSWCACSLCSTWRASGYSPTAALSSCQERVCKQPSSECFRCLAHRCTAGSSSFAWPCFRGSETWPGSTPNQTRTRSRRRRWRSCCGCDW